MTIPSKQKHLMRSRDDDSASFRQSKERVAIVCLPASFSDGGRNGQLPKGEDDEEGVRSAKVIVVVVVARYTSGICVDGFFWGALREGEHITWTTHDS